MNRRMKAAAVGGFVAAALIGGVTGAAPAAAATGVIAYETWEGYGTNGQSDIWTMNADGTNPTNVTPGTADSNEYDPEVSPDGSRIAFISNRMTPTNQDASYEIFTMAIDGSGVQQVTVVESPYGSGIASYEPTWSPDGSKIAFTGFRQYGTAEIYTINADGSGSETRLTDPSDFQGKWEPDWSPDGSKILFTKAWDEWAQDLFTINPDGTGETNLTPETNPDTYSAERNGTWSPDGTRIAFRTDRHCCGIYPNPNAEIYVMEYPSGTLTRVTEHNAIDEEPTWSPDGSQITFVSLRNGSGYDLFVTDAPPVPLTGSAGAADDQFTERSARSAAAEGTVTPLNSAAGDQLDPDWGAGGATPPPVTHTLSVTKAGSGAGSVTSSPAGITCGTDCTEAYTQGTSVTLTARPGKGVAFGGWSGACSGTALTCTVQMSAAKSVTATFGSGGTTTPPPASSYTLSVTKAGSGAGSVTSSPVGISCPTDCTEAYASGTSVTLTARPGKGVAFGGWSGDCSGTSLTCTVQMSQARSVTATFGSGGTTPPPSSSYTLSVTREGNGSVVSSPVGITCGTDCTETYASGTQVTLTARPVKGSSTFAGWGGACSGTATTCVVTMNASKSVTATFRAV